MNFNHINDPVMNKALDDGRSEPDPTKRKADYETFNKRLSSQAYTLWTWYETWFIAHNTQRARASSARTCPTTNGDAGHREAGRRSWPGYHQLLGMWKSK